jgi:glycosyltransferase involved in cell wall biosynthesis
MPLVSVAMPVFNGEKFIRTALDSVAAQTYPSIEVIAVDDGSTDSSADVVKSFGRDVVLVRQKNRGVAAARNEAIARARGDFIAFLDQDDWWLPRKLEEQVSLCQEDPRIGLVHTNVSYYDDALGQFVGLLNPNARSEQLVGECFEQLLLGNALYNSAVVVRRALVELVGPCDLRIPGNTVQDYDLWLRCAQRTRLGHVKEPLTVLRLHPAQGLWKRADMLGEELNVLLRFRPEHDWLATLEGRARLSALHDELATAYLDKNDARLARAHFAKSWQARRSTRQLARFALSCLPLRAIRLMQATKQRVSAYAQRHRYESNQATAS